MNSVEKWAAFFFLAAILFFVGHMFAEVHEYTNPTENFCTMKPTESGVVCIPVERTTAP